MGDTILLIILVLALAFCLCILFIALFNSNNGKNTTKTVSPKRKKGASAPAEEISFIIRKEVDGLRIVVPASHVYDEDDFFPNIINDVTPDDKGLDMQFWTKVSSLPLIEDAAERERLAQTLADEGFIKPESVSEIASINPDEDPGEGNDASSDLDSAFANASSSETPHPVVGPDFPEPVIEPIPEPVVSEQKPSPEIEEPQTQEPEPEPEPEPKPDTDDDAFSRGFNI